MFGAERVIAIDNIPERLQKAKDECGAEIINFDETSVLAALRDMTGGHGPDACMDAVGLEAHGASVDALVDRVKAATFLATDRPHVLREAIIACRKGGTVSIPGVYGGFVDKIPMGAAMNKGLTFKMGQTHVHRYLQPLMNRIVEGEIDPSFIITHTANLDDAPQMYEIFKHRNDNCVKVVLKPHA
jgi:threonine dehydrogenase-like Zn-dependent dehydrogenase